MKKIKYLLFMVLLMPVFVNAQTYTYNVCKNGCEYSELSELLRFLDSKDYNFNNDDITINITDTASYEISSYQINYIAGNGNYNTEETNNINTLTINGNNAEIINNNSSGFWINASNINIKNLRVKDSWIDDLSEDTSYVTPLTFYLLGNKITIEDSEMGKLSVYGEETKIDINNSKITMLNLEVNNLIKMSNSKSQQILIQSTGSIELNDVETSYLYLNMSGSNDTLTNINFNDINVNNFAILSYSTGVINNSNIKGLYVYESQNIDIKNTSGKVLNASENYDSIINVYNPKEMDLTYKKLNDPNNLSEVFEGGSNSDLFDPDKWLYNYIAVKIGEKETKINIFVDKELNIKTNSFSDIKELFSVDNISDLTFNIEDESIAKIENGKINGLKEGTTKITATREDGAVTYTLNLTVEKESIPEKIDKMTIKVPITGKKVKMWIILVSVLLLIVIGACVCMLIRRKK